MQVKGISWLGIATDRYEESLHLFTNVLGLKVAAGHDGQCLLRAGDALVELFGNDGRGKTLTNPPVAAFEVDNVEAAKAALQAGGVELIGDIGRWNGFEWLYFRSPDGHLFSVKKTPSPGWETSTV